MTSDATSASPGDGAPGRAEAAAAPLAGAVVLGPDGAGALVTPDGALLAEGGAIADALRGAGPGARWVVWSARAAAPLLAPLGGAEAAAARTWDLAEAHRLRHGGWAADPASVWAAEHGLDPSGIPAAPAGDLFDLLSEDDAPERLVRPDGYLRPEASTGAWLTSTDRCRAMAQAALDVARRQLTGITEAGPRALLTARSESAAAVLCLELERDGLPLDRAEAQRLVTAAAGPEPRTLQEELDARAARDAPVLATVPGAPQADLRNPAAVRRLLAVAGVEVESTRRWELEAHREDHPVVPALLSWRKAERVATTYGWRWLREHVGEGDRLRGRWSACDGAAGRMTAQAGLHNLPAELRPAVAAAPGHRFVRADLGQIEPRVLAVVSGDASFAAATRAPDLYAPVAERLGVERAVAKVAVLAAMYGQRSGAAGEALGGLERAYPTAMRYLEAAAEAGRRGEAVRTFGGRLVRTDLALGLDRPDDRGRRDEAGAPEPGAVTPEQRRARDAARGRFARNAVIQGSAAELFKVWAVTARSGLRPVGGQIVLCLHDELLVHVPEEHAGEAVATLERTLQDAARWWVAAGDDTRGSEVRFVADVSVVQRWSEAK